MLLLCCTLFFKVSSHDKLWFLLLTEIYGPLSDKIIKLGGYIILATSTWLLGQVLWGNFLLGRNQSQWIRESKIK